MFGRFEGHTIDAPPSTASSVGEFQSGIVIPWTVYLVFERGERGERGEERTVDTNHRGREDGHENNPRQSRMFKTSGPSEPSPGMSTSCIQTSQNVPGS